MNEPKHYVPGYIAPSINEAPCKPVFSYECNLIESERKKFESERNKLKKHKHAELIKAWADGAEIEYRYISKATSEWTDWKRFDGSWSTWVVAEDFEYRIKPEPRPDTKTFLTRSKHTWVETSFGCFVGKPIEGFILTRDGETNEIKSVEIMK
jgi:hypothetical protein